MAQVATIPLVTRHMTLATHHVILALAPRTLSSDPVTSIVRLEGDGRTRAPRPARMVGAHGEAAPRPARCPVVGVGAHGEAAPRPARCLVVGVGAHGQPAHLGMHGVWSTPTQIIVSLWTL